MGRACQRASTYFDGGAPAAARSRCLPHRPTIQRQQGFTLLEMLAVILLIGIAAAAISVSVSQGLISARANAASGELAAALRQTRTEAIVSGEQKVFELDTRRGTYRADGHAEVRLPQGLRLGLTSAQEDRISDGAGRIRFFADGSSTGGRVTLQRGRRQWHVNVSWLTGAISVVDTGATASVATR